MQIKAKHIYDIVYSVYLSITFKSSYEFTCLVSVIGIRIASLCFEIFECGGTSKEKYLMFGQYEIIL